MTNAILFVAAGVPEAEIVPDRFGGALEVVRLGPGADGLGQISGALAGRRGLDGLHILGGGEPVLDAAALEAGAEAVAGWGAALRTGAGIRLHGCGLGASAGGWDLLGRLATLTGSDVAACDEVGRGSILGG